MRHFEAVALRRRWGGEGMGEEGGEGDKAPRRRRFVEKRNGRHL
jgi:hypothetical protein